MGIFINGIGSISAQKFHPSDEEILFENPSSNRWPCKEPDYKDLVPPMQLRRMSKVVRMGVASAKAALFDAGIEKPDVITLGTSYGCLADTENFLGKLISQDETMLTPTAFIQSTHNTVSGQIALMIACHGHNFTFVHRGHSFETSLQESMMWLKEQKDFTILTGGVDELTNHSFDIMSRFGTYKIENESFDTYSEGTIAGEGSSMFVLSNQQQENSYAEIKDVCLCMQDDIAIQLSDFLAKNNLQPNDIDVCLLGVNGDNRYDETIMKNVESLSNAILVGFKKWCGEFPTSGSFALALASHILKHQHVPQQLKLKTQDGDTKPNNVLVYNHYKNQFHSFTLISRI